MSDTNNFVYKTGEVLKRLNLKDSVFKKYVFSLEKEGYSFQRNNLGHRLFTEEDIKALEMFLELISYDGMTIESVARKIGTANKKQIEPMGHDVMTGNDIDGHDVMTENDIDGHDVMTEKDASSHDAMTLMSVLLKEQEQRFVRLLQEQEQTFKNEIQAIKDSQIQEVYELKKTLLERMDDDTGTEKRDEILIQVMRDIRETKKMVAASQEDTKKKWWEFWR
ncbi:DUF3967 domain-containing protein [Priestia aryabhattai]|uniref:DUF3967 domain-containing protein n=1 Tax=Priestia aryabhattai TaxID=412384 RepID=UPI003D2E704E